VINSPTSFRNQTDSTHALLVQNAAGSNLLVVDTQNSRLAVGPAAVPANGVLTVGTNTTTASGGLYFGTDTNLYRENAGVLSTDSALNVYDGIYVEGGSNGSIVSVQSVTADPVLLSYVSGDAEPRLKIESGGQIFWGDGTNTPDTTLYRSGVSTLTTDGGLVVNNGDEAGLVALRVLGTDATVEIEGTDLSYIDTPGSWSNQSTAGDSVLRASDGDLILAARNASGNILFTTGAADTTKATLTSAGQLQLSIQGSTGGIQIGSDTHIYRGAANRVELAAGDSLRVSNAGGELLTLQSDVGGTYLESQSSSSSDWLTAAKVLGDANQRFILKTSGEMQWGSGSATPDIILSRSGAGNLLLQSTSNGANAFEIQNSSNATLLNFDASVANGHLEIGGDTGGADKLELYRADTTTENAIRLTTGSGVDWKIYQDDGSNDFRLWNDTANQDTLIVDQDGETRINAQSSDVLVLNNTDGDTGVVDGEVSYLQYEIGGAELWESGVEDNNTYFLYNDVDGELGFTLNSNEAILQVDNSATEGLTVQRYDGTEFFDAQAYDPGVGSMLASLAIGEGFPASEVLFTNGGNEAWSIGSSDFNSGGADGFYLWNDVADEETLTIDSTSNIWVENGSFNVNVDNNNAFVVEDNSDVDIFAVDTNGASATGVTIGGGTQIEKVLHFAVNVDPASTAQDATVCATGTVTGAATSDTIVANPDPNDLLDGFAWHGARVSASNTMQACFVKVSATSQDPGNAITIFGIIITP
jgi:hypothetical protein